VFFGYYITVAADITVFAAKMVQNARNTHLSLFAMGFTSNIPQYCAGRNVVLGKSALLWGVSSSPPIVDALLIL
jgi:hypothetical protein